MRHGQAGPYGGAGVQTDQERRGGHGKDFSEQHDADGGQGPGPAFLQRREIDLEAHGDEKESHEEVAQAGEAFLDFGHHARFGQDHAREEGAQGRGKAELAREGGHADAEGHGGKGEDFGVAGFFQTAEGAGNQTQADGQRTGHEGRDASQGHDRHHPVGTLSVRPTVEQDEDEDGACVFHQSQAHDEPGEVFFHQPLVGEVLDQDGGGTHAKHGAEDERVDMW
jgi:hypothetical protein